MSGEPGGKYMSNTKVRKGKRRWYPILAPKIFESQPIGETFVFETEQIEGKHMTVNLMTLTGNPKKQNMNVFLKVTEVKEGTAHTMTRGIEMQQSSTRRMVRRGRSKIADSFPVKTKKGQRVRIKPLIMTRNRCDAATQSAIRQKARELIRETFKKYSFDTVVNDIVHNRLQRYLKDQLSAVFPIRSADIRYLRYEAADNEAEDEMEQTEYSERPKLQKKAPESTEGLAGLKEELDEALAEEKEEVETKEKATTGAKKKTKKVKDDSEDADDSEEEQ